MATTGLADSMTSKFDATTPPKASQLPADIVGKLLVNLDAQIGSLKADDQQIDIEGIMAFQRAANYLYA